MVLEKITLPTHADSRGNLTVLELKDYIDWDVRRVYYVTDTVAPRGGHAVRAEKKIYVVMAGSCRGRFHDGKKWIEFDLHGPGDCVKMEGLYYREFVDFTPGTVLMAVSSVNYDKRLYIYDFEEFLREAGEV
jgi:hypothetical protein